MRQFTVSKAKLAFLLLSAISSLPLLAAPIVDDTFADANSRNQDLSANSLRLFNGRANTVRTEEPGRIQFDITNAGGSDAVWAFFTDSGAPVRLQPGDSLSVSVTFSVNGFPATGQDIRFGLFDSLATRNTADLTGGMNQATFIDDPGYGLTYVPSGSGSSFTLGRRANLATGNIFNSFGDFATLQTNATPNPARQTLAEDTPYTLQFTIHRRSETETRLTVNVSGGALDGLSYAVSDSGPNLPNAFDYFAFRVTGPAFAQRLRFHRVLVDYTPAPPVILSQPQPSQLLVQVGANVRLAASATGSQLRYQWNRNSEPLSPTANPSVAQPILELNRVALSDAGSYTLTVSNDGGSVTSNPVTLRVSQDPVAPPPTIRTQPQPTTVTVGQSAQLSVSATGANLAYQWFKDGQLLPSANSATLAIPSASLRDAGEYAVLVSNPSGTITSAPARLAVVSRLTVVSTYPASGATNLCVDPPFALTFSAKPAIGKSGQIRLLRADGSVADLIDLRATAFTRLVGSANTPFNYLPIQIEDNTAYLAFPRSRLAPGESYAIEITEGAFTDSDGLPFRGRSASAWTLSTRTLSPAPNATSLLVAADGSGDYCSVQSAIDHVPAGNTRRVVIQVKAGDYREFVYVPSGKNFITLRGEDRNTTIRYPNNANFNASQRQTFGVDANDFTLEHLTIRNTTPKGGSQAEAFRGNGTRLLLNYVNLYSFQDTLWLQGLAMVNSSYIEGDVDFMWGNGAVFFQDSELRMVSSGGYYTQIRNPQGRFGNVYLKCRFTADPGVTGAYLSRIDPAVFPFSQVVLLESQIGPHVRPEAWLLNNAPNTAAAAPNVQFFEFDSRDLQGQPLDLRGRAPFSRQLTAAEASRFIHPASVLGGWEPQFKLSAGLELSGLERNFTGSPLPISVTTTPPDLPVRITYAGSLTPPTAVGSYPVTVEVLHPDYQGFVSATLLIRQTAVTITLSNLTQTFDGSPKQVRLAASPVVDGIAVDGIVVTYNGSPNLPVQPGQYAVLALLDTPNLRGRASATFTIRPAGSTQLPAFPGAEGEGALSRGGRGGDVYHVTNLEDSGPGSLRQGILSATGPRTIVFDVAGTIELKSRLSINRSFLTIAGQTAPGDGITLAGWPAVISNANNVVLRYLRFRMGDRNCPAVQDDALWVDRASQVIIDHVSASWSIDETLSVTDATQVTVQWSFITESLRNSCHEKGAHGYGSLIRFGDGLVSFHHNLMAHHDSRNPRVGDNIGLDFANNIVYNWGSTPGYSGASEEGNTRLNLAGNLFLSGPSSAPRPRAFNGGGTNTVIYLENNLLNGEASEWAMVQGTFTRRETERFPFAQVETAAPEDALAQVLASAGASLRRDAVDRRIVEEVRTRSGKIINSQREVGGWPLLAPGNPLLDTDGDGMPDIWESARGLNPRDPADGPRSSVPNAPAGTVYTNLELYLNELAAAPSRP